MKLLILVGLIYSAYCSDVQDGYKNEERRIAGGGNYGGFIGLTTYGGGPFLVKGKYERDEYEEFGSDRQGYEPGYDPRTEQLYDDVPQKYDGNNDGKPQDFLKKDDDKNDDGKKSDRGLEAKYIGNIGYEDIQSDGKIRGGITKQDADLEYLGYRGGKGYCIGQYDDRDGYKNRDGRGQNRKSNYSDFYDNDTRERCDYLFGYTGPTANDEPENLMRPCALDDWQCIRNFFAANGKCKPAYGPIPDPLYIDVNTIFYPVVNITVTLPNLQVRGLSSAKIREFYVNQKSGNLVFALDVTNLNLTIPRAYYRYRRTAKESIVLADFTTIVYRSLTLTAVISKVPNLRLDLADIHADVQDGTPPFFIGPGAANSTDPDVLSAFTPFAFAVPFDVREALLFLSQLFTSIYIQENICDFGLKLISV